MPSPLRASLATLLAMQLITVIPAFGTNIAAVDQNGGYSDKVLDKVIAIWALPPNLKGDFTVRLKVSLDGQGKVLDCKPAKASGIEALDSSACGAVYQAAPFGTPPYGMPLDVHLAFWSGTPKSKAQAETLSTEEALRAEVMARTKAEGLMGQQRGSSVEERARERAEAIAKNAGQPLPDVKTAPVAPLTRAKAVPGATKKNASKSSRSGLSTDSPATVSISSAKGKNAALSAPAMQLVSGSGKTAAPATATSQPAESKPTVMAQDQYDARYRKYISTITQNLRNAMLIPAETAPGTYYATVRLNVDAAGAIKKSTLLQGSGDKLLDKFVLQGIRRAGSVTPSPSGLGNTLDITFTLVRR
ncbi:TonB family protein [uncultured Desulfovibrio sp.]|uniref:TonB family protein n=1 Tax=uncultured Desulfovibrio sp. TaxID=167968 RepID=UPI0026019422|nr:TonB family protein [uncultured Desulfovibrio sp.]